MHGMIAYKTFDCQRDWNAALPGLDWVGYVLPAFDAAYLCFVLKIVMEYSNQRTDLGVGLGSDWDRIGLDLRVFSLAFVIKQHVQDKAQISCLNSGRIVVVFGLE